MYEDNKVTEVVSVKFKGNGKAYYFDANGCAVRPGEDVIVETSKGLEYARCVAGNHYVSNEKVVPPIRPVIRVATDNGRRVQEINRQREREALGICREKIAAHGLDMKLVDAECSFEGNKLTFYFTSDGRVDFRELVKDLASVFRSRIELRQIGVRDEAKMLGGLGTCGRPFCCSQFLTDFQPVSTKMAKTQSLSLNPQKISGVCGRLMCCLRYEEEAYESLVKAVPKNGAFVETPAGFGTVIQVNLLRGVVKVRLDGEGEAVIKTYNGDEVAAVPGGRPKNGEAPQHVLKPRAESAPVREEAASDADGAAVSVEAAERHEPPQPRQSAPVRRKSHRGGRRGGGAGEAKQESRREGKGEGKRERGDKPGRGQQPHAKAQQPEGQGQQPQQPKRSHRGRRGGRGSRPPAGGAEQ